MNKQDLDILMELYTNSYTNQRIVSEETGYSIGSVNKSIKALSESGMIDDDMMVTVKANEYISTMSPCNAIILAAGYGMRMAPINMETPKAFLEVYGERLIDRLIKQLHEVGITDVTVVVGFMKDSFEYLIDEYRVKLVFAADYASTNNLHSLATVADKIDNTYIVPCDIWCNKNPFNKHELYSWYMVNDLVEEESDVRVNRKMDLVKIPVKSGGNGMVGISYLTGDEAETVKTRVKEYVQNPIYDDKFWEETLYTNDRMIVKAKVVHAADVVEINTYEQLRDLDSDSNQLKSDALQIISEKLCCREEDIVDIEVLKKGMTNRSFLFRIDSGENAGKYIMRIPGEGTEQLINRAAEAKVYEAISGLGFCDDPVYINPENGYKITKFIEGVHCCDPENEDDLRLCIRKLREFHNYKENGKVLTVPHTFDLSERLDFYESLWNGNPSVYRDYDKTKKNCKSLIPFVEKYRGDMQLTHIDAVPDNFLFDSEGNIQLTDWEYSSMQDKHVDIAMFCIYSLYNKAQIDHFIDLYFEADGGCDTVTRAKIYCYVAICGLIWSNWCEYKRNLGVEFGEYSLYQYRYGKEFYKYATELISDVEG